MTCITLNTVSRKHPNGSLLFKDISFSCSNEKTGLTGVNGIGKSTLAKIITGDLQPDNGAVQVHGTIACIPQNLASYQNKPVSDIFGVTPLLQLQNNILAGKATTEDLLLFGDNWDLDDRIHASLQKTATTHIGMERIFSTLSGGEQVRIMYSALLLKNPDFILLDEPTNHLDSSMRDFVYQFIMAFPYGMLIISHDRALMRLLDRIIEMNNHGIAIYGGGFDFYEQQKAIELQAKNAQLIEAKAELRKTVKLQQDTMFKQERRIRGAAKSAPNAGIPKIVLNTLANRGEKTSSKLREVHNKKVATAQTELERIKAIVEPQLHLQIDYSQSRIPREKILIDGNRFNFQYNGSAAVWQQPLTLQIKGPERVHIAGNNGSGKSTLLRLISCELRPTEGQLLIHTSRTGILDQRASLLQNEISVLENVRFYAQNKITETELRIRLARFLFFNDDVYKPASVLSGGERMRAAMACMFAHQFQPDILLLDEPTNNLDLAAVQQLTLMLQEYSGAMLVVSHDIEFIQQIGVDRTVTLSG